MKNIHTYMRRLLCLILALAVTTACMFPMGLEANAATGDALDVTLSDPSKTSYLEEEPIYIKATGTVPGAWIGLYGKGEPKVSGVASYRWFYVAEYEGMEVDITDFKFDDGNGRGAISEGEYEIVLFGDDGYSNIVKTINITVIDNPNVLPSDQMSLKLVDETKTTYKLGEAIPIRATGTAEGAWVGLYGIEDKMDTAAGGVASYRWYYVKDYNGIKVDITNVNMDQSSRKHMEEGEYIIRLFGDEGFSNVLASIPITIAGTIEINPDLFELEVEKTDYKYGENIMVRAVGTGINGGAWVGLYHTKVDNYEQAYLYYYYIKDKQNQFVPIQTQIGGNVDDSKLPQGKYKLVLFADDSYNYPVKSLELSVTRDVASSKVLREPGCVTYGKESVVYKDGYTEIREIEPLGEHLWGECVHVKGTSKHQQTCQRPTCDRTKTTDCVMGSGVVTKTAKVGKAGERTFTCEGCGNAVTESIAALKKAPTLAADSFVYNGKNRKPTLQKLYDTKGNVIPKKFYTVKYAASCKKAGTYKVKVTFKGDYAGTYNLSYQIQPKAVTLNALTKGKKSLKVSWKKAAAETTGYRIAYSTDKNFKNVKYVKVNKKSQTSVTIQKLKAKTKYYVKIRAYKTSGGRTYYSAWSKVKSVKTK